MLVRRGIAALFVVAACAPAPPPPVVAPPPPAVAPVPSILLEPAPLTPERAPIAPLEAIDLVDDQAAVLVYVDVRVLREGDLWIAAQPALHALGWDETLASWKKACGGDDPIDAIDHVVLSFGDQSVAIATLRPDAEKALVCARGIAGGTDGELAGHPVLRARGMVVARVDRFLLVGDESIVKARLLQAAAGGRSRAGRELLDRSPGIVGSLVSAPIEFFGFGRSTWQLRATPRELSLEAELDMTKVALATRMVAEGKTQLRAGSRKLADDAEGARALGGLLDRTVLRQSGSVVHGRLAAPDGDDAARRTLLADVTVFARAVASEQRRDDARSHLRELARRLEEESRVVSPATKKPRGIFPPSAPRTPKEIPVGRPTKVPASAWEGTWKTLAVTMPTALQHSYEIVTSADRKSVTLRAIGDPEGRGVETIELTIDARGARRERESVARPRTRLRGQIASANARR